MQTKTDTKFKKWPLAVGAVAAVFASALVPSASTMAWGPERTTFTMENPADYVTFNSITNNNILGDERNFVRVVEADTGNAYADEVKVVPGKEYEVYVFYHNNAKSRLNASGVGIATGVVVSSKYPSSINANNKGKVSALISSPVANPTQVWDEAYFTTDSPVDVALRYVPGSAHIWNDNFATNGATLSDNLFGDGILIGVNKLDGNLPGCSEYSGHIIYRVRAEQVGAKVTKTVSKDGENFFDRVLAAPGDILTYRVEFINSGTTTLTDVTFHDKLPEGVTLVEGTTVVKDSVGNEQKLSDLIGQNGYNLGNFGQGVSATITYQVKVNDDIVKDAACGTHSYSNRIYVDHTDGEISDGATFEVQKTGCTTDDGCEAGDPNCTPAELPKTGPAEIALAVTATIAVVVGGTYWYHSQKALEEAQMAAGAAPKKNVADKKTVDKNDKK
ncbi:DUF11 domain-containing protein [Candidatus Saccharibacteria bacterium]|nr:DUF11 domain-containing protein [Candidatus Saccharibacteria bacterium]